jgi:hypothetical protein
MTMRRGFLAFTAGAVVAKTVLPVAAGAKTAATSTNCSQDSSHPDAALLASIARFNVLEHHISAHYSGGAFHIEDDDERDEALEPFRDEQQDLLPLICPVRAVTHEGIVAKAQMLNLWDSTIRRGLDDLSWEVQMTAGIMLDLLPAGAANV